MSAAATNELRELRSRPGVELAAWLAARAAGPMTIDRGFLEEVLSLLAHARKDVRRYAADLVAEAVRQGVGVDDVLAVAAGSEARASWGAAFACFQAGRTDEVLFKAALGTIDSEDGDLRWSAAELVTALAPLHDEDFASLKQLAAGGAASSSARRKMALYCLRNLGAACVDLFAAALDDGASEVRLAAMAALGRRGAVTAESTSAPSHRLVVSALKRTLDADPDPGVRRTAAVTLGCWAVGDEEVIGLLRDLADGSRDKDPQLAHAATVGLRRAETGGAAAEHEES